MSNHRAVATLALATLLFVSGLLAGLPAFGFAEQELHRQASPGKAS
jgi:hypothetical protein